MYYKSGYIIHVVYPSNKDTYQCVHFRVVKGVIFVRIVLSICIVTTVFNQGHSFNTLRDSSVFIP